jgi:hypothetical protein
MVLYDVIIQGNGTTDCGWGGNAGGGIYSVKTRGFTFVSGVANTTSGGVYRDVLIDCNNVAASRGIIFGTTGNITDATNLTVRNCIIPAEGGSSLGNSRIVLRNYKGFSGLINASGQSGIGIVSIYFEDRGGNVGLNTMINQTVDTAKATTTMSTTSNLRSGGGINNLYVIPSPTSASNNGSGFSTQNFPHSYLKLFEYPIYSDGTSETYQIYFRSATSGSFTTSPLTNVQTGSTTPELFIECEYYGASSGAERFLKRSTTSAAVAIAGNTTWDDLSLTCDPAQAGILYLRGWYAKPREAASNKFYMDTTPVIN